MGRRIMIVGNGEIAEDLSSVIDAADLVVRFNEFRSFGPGGERTDILAACNTGRPAKAMLSSPAWRESRPVADCREIWSVRDPLRFRELAGELVKARPDLDDFCEDFTNEFEALAIGLGKRHRIIDRRVHDSVDAALRRAGAGDYVCPSSGMLVITEVLSSPEFAGDSVSIVGFSHQGWGDHPFAVERELVDAHVMAGRLSRLAPETLSSPLQGA